MFSLVFDLLEDVVGSASWGRLTSCDGSIVDRRLYVWYIVILGLGQKIFRGVLSNDHILLHTLSLVAVSFLTRLESILLTHTVQI